MIVVKSAVHGMKHPVVASEIDDMPPVFVLFDKGGIGYVPV